MENYRPEVFYRRRERYTHAFREMEMKPSGIVHCRASVGPGSFEEKARECLFSRFVMEVPRGGALMGVLVGGGEKEEL